MSEPTAEPVAAKGNTAVERVALIVGAARDTADTFSDQSVEGALADLMGLIQLRVNNGSLQLTGGEMDRLRARAKESLPFTSPQAASEAIRSLTRLLDIPFFGGGTNAR
jgi:hypothetical protein